MMMMEERKMKIIVLGQSSNQPKKSQYQTIEIQGKKVEVEICCVSLGFNGSSSSSSLSSLASSSSATSSSSTSSIKSDLSVESLLEEGDAFLLVFSKDSPTSFLTIQRNLKAIKSAKMVKNSSPLPSPFPLPFPFSFWYIYIFFSFSFLNKWLIFSSSFPPPLSLVS